MADELKILDTIKTMLAIEPDYDVFDGDIIAHINTALMTLNQLGVGKEDFILETGKETWADFLDNGGRSVPGVKTFIFLTVKSAFDPPPTSFVIDAYERQLRELTYRLNTQVETLLDLEGSE